MGGAATAGWQVFVLVRLSRHDPQRYARRALRSPGLDPGVRRALIDAGGTEMSSLRSSMHRIFNQTTLIAIYTVMTILAVIFGLRLQHKAFTPPAASGPIFVAVFVQHPNAELDLKAYIDTGQPSADQLAVRVKSGNPGQWLVIIQCPSNPQANLYPQNATLTSAVPPPTQIDSMQKVIEETGMPSRTSPFSLHCFQPAPPGAYNIANVTLPALGTDQAIADVGHFPTLYEDKTQLVQVFPGVQCPVPAPSSAASASSSVTTSASPSVTPPAPSTGTGGSTQPTSPSASATASSSSPQSPDCFATPPAGTSFSKYYVPKTLKTQEILNAINWGGYTYETEYPNPVTESSDNITWAGSSGLSPSITVADPANDRAVSEDTFISGILFGIAGGTAVSLIDHLVQVNEKRRARKRNSENVPDPQSTIILEPAADDGSHYLRLTGSGANGQNQLSSRQELKPRPLPPLRKAGRSNERRGNHQTEKTRKLIKRWQAGR
jgi:hypothetical protein